jgi:hypothetical protein
MLHTGLCSLKLQAAKSSDAAHGKLDLILLTTQLPDV